MNGLQTLPQWREYFGQPDGALLGLINAVYPLVKVVALLVSAVYHRSLGPKVATAIWPSYVHLLLNPSGPRAESRQFRRRKGVPRLLHGVLESTFPYSHCRSRIPDS